MRVFLYSKVSTRQQQMHHLSKSSLQPEFLTVDSISVYNGPSYNKQATVQFTPRLFAKRVKVPEQEQLEL